MYKLIISFILFIIILLWVYVFIKNNLNGNYQEAFTNFSKEGLDQLSSLLDTEHIKDQKNPIFERLTKIMNLDSDKKKSKEKKRSSDKKNKKEKENSETIPIANKPTNCKFMSSYSESYTCPEKTPTHLGAVFGANASSGISCNGTKIEEDIAVGIPQVKDGKINKIKLISKGSNYDKPPKVKIIGDGSRAKAIAIMDEDTSIKKIKIINGGENYKNTPKVQIDPPNAHVYCHLCCNLSEY